jgi:hypothetical protein
VVEYALPGGLHTDTRNLQRMLDNGDYVNLSLEIPGGIER